MVGLRAMNCLVMRTQVDDFYLNTSNRFFGEDGMNGLMKVA
jgi:hypothetical protein